MAHPSSNLGNLGRRVLGSPVTCQGRVEPPGTMWLVGGVSMAHVADGWGLDQSCARGGRQHTHTMSSAGPDLAVDPGSWGKVGGRVTVPMYQGWPQLTLVSCTRELKLLHNCADEWTPRKWIIVQFHAESKNNICTWVHLSESYGILSSFPTMLAEWSWGDLGLLILQKM